MYYCLHCVIKHLAKAKVNHEEARMGYPDHLLDVIGNLAEAENEIFGISKELADEIRQYRLIILSNLENPNVELPYYELFRRVKKIVNENDCGTCAEASDAFKEKLAIKNKEVKRNKSEPVDQVNQANQLKEETVKQEK